MKVVSLSDGNFAFKQGNKFLGRTCESANNIGFGYSYDMPGVKDSLCFYSNNEPWTKAQAVVKLRNKLKEGAACIEF
jgi:hypothetical protein